MKEFDFSERDAKKVGQIQRQYLKKAAFQIEQLEALHEKVKAPGMILAAVVGIIGTLLIGAGIAEDMLCDNLKYGLCLSIPGLILVFAAFPLYSIITGIRKRKYANQVHTLSSLIVRESPKS